MTRLLYKNPVGLTSKPAPCQTVGQTARFPEISCILSQYATHLDDLLAANFRFPATSIFGHIELYMELQALIALLHR